MRFDKNLLDEIRERNDLRLLYPQQLIRDRHQDREWINAVCQFHTDNNPSMGISKYGFRCKSASCGVHGDIFFYVQLAEAVDFPTSVKILSEKTVLTPYVAPEKPRVNVVKKAEFSWDEALRFTKSMRDDDYEYLESEKAIKKWVSESLGIGSLPIVNAEHSGLYTIPIVGDNPEKIEDIKIYNPMKQYGRAKYYHLKSGVTVQLAFLGNIPEGEDEVFIVAGEHDYACAFGSALPAVTSTGGESIWRPEWTAKLERFKHIWVVYDNDKAGWEGANKVMREIPQAHRINFGLVDGDKIKDFADFCKAGYDIDKFGELQKECLKRYG